MFINPPLHPPFPQDLEQSTNCCSEQLSKIPVVLKCSPSRAPVVEKAQQDPHCPWFLMGVTAPLADQSTESGRWSIGTWGPVHFLVSAIPLGAALGAFIIKQRLENSLLSMSANKLSSRSQLSSPASYLALCSSTMAAFSRYFPNLNSFSCSVAQALPFLFIQLSNMTLLALFSTWPLWRCVAKRASIVTVARATNNLDIMGIYIMGGNGSHLQQSYAGPIQIKISFGDCNNNHGFGGGVGQFTRSAKGLLLQWKQSIIRCFPSGWFWQFRTVSPTGTINTRSHGFWGQPLINEHQEKQSINIWKWIIGQSKVHQRGEPDPGSYVCS